MNAETTARRVLAWAAAAAPTPTPPTPAPPSTSSTPGSVDRPRATVVSSSRTTTAPGVGGARSLPAGPLRSATTLARPSAATMAELTSLARSTGARLGAGAPPFGDGSPIGLGAVVLAGAIGGRGQPGLATMLAEAVPAPRLDGPAAAGGAGWADALARHAVVMPALAALALMPAPVGGDAEPLAETLLRHSPLTAVLHRPPLAALADGATAGDVAAVRNLMTRPRGTTVLHAAIARFSPDPAVLGWRTELLTRLATDHPTFVLDAYVAARLRHGEEWDGRVADARRAFNGVNGPDALCMAIARFWLPLARLRRRDPDLLRARPLLTGHEEALRLVDGRHHPSIAGAA